MKRKKKTLKRFLTFMQQDLQQSFLRKALRALNASALIYLFGGNYQCFLRQL